MPTTPIAVTTEDRWVQTAAGRLFTRSWTPAGEREVAAAAPLVLFHDSLGCVELWRTFPERLCARTGRRVIAYDRLGFGKSDPRHDTLSPDFIRKESERFIPALRDHLGFPEFIPFGHSVGGGMAVVCAGMFAESCRALITESAQAFVEDRTLTGILDARENFRGEGQVDRLRKYHGTKAEWVLSAWIDTWLSPEFARWSLDADLPKVACPVLAIHGSDDEFGSILHPETICRLAAGPARMEFLPGCGHVPHREQEDAILSLVTRFLEGV